MNVIALRDTDSSSSILLVLEQGGWVAVWLESGIAATGKAPLDAITELQRMVERQSEIDRDLGKEPFEDAPGARSKDWELFNNNPYRMELPLGFRRVETATYDFFDERIPDLRRACA